MTKNIKILVLFFLVAIFAFNIKEIAVFAQADESAAEQREFRVEERAEEAFKKPDTVKELMELLKERAKLKMEDKRWELLTKKRISLGLFTGFESNPLNASPGKGDYYVEEDFSISWLPTFNRHLGANIGYWLVNQSYFEQTDVSSLDHAINATLKIYPFKSGNLNLEPGVEYEWLWYPKDERSSYENFKYFIKFKRYIGREWNFGGKYEHSDKTYDKKPARTASRDELTINREDERHTGELYLTRYLGKYSIKLKGKVYRNTSNDAYQEYYDYDSWRAYLTLGGTFLEDDKLYVSLTPSFERKNYAQRLAVDTARYDDIYHLNISAYYTLKKNWLLSYKFIYKEVDSNYPAGEYKDITNHIGISVDF